MTPTILLIGTLDTKGDEYRFVKECLEASGCKTLVVDVGVQGTPKLKADITREEVAKRAGVDLAGLIAKKDRGEAMQEMGRAAAIILPELYAAKLFDGVLALGGSSGTSVACSGMRALPLGVPKVMVSTLAASDVSGFIGVKDIVMMPSIVDIVGINRFSREVFARAASVITALVQAKAPQGSDKPLIAASMFGNTTTAVTKAKAVLEEAGFEVLVFHATGSGGKTMESLIEARLIAGVLDITTTEWADELVGGILTAGPNRLDAAATTGTPAIVVPGCLDMVNFGPPHTVPEKFKGRLFYQHNPNVTLMRTDVQENRRLGEIIAEKLNQSRGFVTLLLPLQGLSVIDSPGGPFWWPEANQALFRALKKNLRRDIPVIELDCNINDATFATKCVEILLTGIKTDFIVRRK